MTFAFARPGLSLPHGILVQFGFKRLWSDFDEAIGWSTLAGTGLR